MHSTSHHYLGVSIKGFHKVHYLSWGQSTPDRATLCVHGMSRNAHDFDYLAQDLATDRWVVCPDVVGRGESDYLRNPALYTFPQYIADMTALIARLNVPQVDWIGTSMGGLIGLIMAAQPQTPIRRLVINDVGPYVPQAGLKRILDYVSIYPNFPTVESGERYLRQILSPFGKLLDSQWHHLANYGLKKNAQEMYELRYDPFIAQTPSVQSLDLWSTWAALTCPILVLHGKNSDILREEVLQKMKELQPKITVLEIEDVGHAPALMDLQQIKTIRQWLDA